MRDQPALTGMRGVAALVVVGFHAVIFAIGLAPDAPDSGPWSSPLNRYLLGWGFIGVDFFFVLSAFLLSQPLIAGPAPSRWRVYVAKRLLRIAPPYYAALLLTGLLMGSRHPWFAMDWTETWRHLTYLHGFWPESQLQVSPVFWTLAVELQFYLLLPLLVLPFRTRWWPVAAAAAVALSMVYRAWCIVPGDGGLTHFRVLQFPSYLGHFALGIAAARLRSDGLRAPRWGDGLALAAVVAFIVVPAAAFGIEATAFGAETTSYVVLFEPLVGAGFAALIFVATSGARFTSSLLSSWPFQRLGAWSYSLYLTHYTVGGFLVLAWPMVLSWGLGPFAVLMVTASLAVAALFFAGVERPSLRLKDVVAHRLSSPPSTKAES